MAELKEREKHILEAIVQNFILTANPVGSRAIARRSELELSSATIRNTMSDLEEMGLITHPHTSAGRVPTDKGYRFYVNSLMSVDKLSQTEKDFIRENVEKQLEKDVDEVLEKSSQVLARLTRQLGIVLAPRFIQGIFDRLELISLSSDKIMVILKIRSGLVRTIMMEMKSEISREKMERVSASLNERLSGLSLEEIKNTFPQRVKDVPDENTGIVRLFIDSVDKLFEFEDRSTLHYQGARNIMHQPEFYQREKFEGIVELLEDRDIIIHLFSEREAGPGVLITIGGENKDEILKNCSIITAQYHLGDVQGTVGIIGPTRMRYSKMIPAVQYTAQVISEVLEISR